MKYYNIQFEYGPCCTVGMPGPYEASYEASAANFAADDLVQQTAKDNGIEMVHAYSWPDGSLYKYVRTSLSMEEIKKVFTIKKEMKRPGEDSEEPEKMTMSIYPSISEMPFEQVQSIGIGAGFFVTLEERFALYAKHSGDPTALNKALFAIHDERKEELNDIPDYTAYSKARDACAVCKPGKLACEDCGKLSKISWAAREAFLEKCRPLSESSDG